MPKANSDAFQILSMLGRADIKFQKSVYESGETHIKVKGTRFIFNEELELVEASNPYTGDDP